MRKIRKVLGFGIVAAAILFFAVPNLARALVDGTLTIDNGTSGLGADILVSSTNGTSVYCIEGPTGGGLSPAQPNGGSLPWYIGEHFQLSVPVSDGIWTITDVPIGSWTGFCNSDPESGFLTFEVTSGQVDPGIPPDTSTRFISVTPEYASTTDYTTTIGAEVYINEDDWVEGTVLRMRFVNNTIQNGIGGSALEAWEGAFGNIEIPLVSGLNDVSTTTTFDRIGQVNAEYKVVKPSTIWFIGRFLPSAQLLSTTTRFYVVEPTGLDIALASTTDILVSALITGTTTQSVIRCNPGNFDISTCLISLIIPPASVFTDALTNLRDDALTHFPVGYVTDFINILSTSTVGSLTVINATVPAGIPGAGSTVHLDLTGSLDSVLGATVGTYGTSTETLYEVTSYYWEILVYILAAMYLLRRILGSHVIPRFKHHGNSIKS